MRIVFKGKWVHNNENRIKHIYNCPKCAARLTDRISRERLVKMLLPWLPLRRYICYKCLTTCYVYGKSNFYKQPEVSKAQYTLDFQK